MELPVEVPLAGEPCAGEAALKLREDRGRHAQRNGALDEQAKRAAWARPQKCTFAASARIISRYTGSDQPAFSSAVSRVSTALTYPCVFL